MKPLSELIHTEDPGWELISEWIKEATNKLEILPKNKEEADNALYLTQVTTRSPMGAILHETGGILVDHGWIRILGSGHIKLNRTLPDWNKGKTFKTYGEKPSLFLIADDAVGGFFAINGGSLGEDLGNVYYFAPDTLDWEPMDMGYSDFIWWTFTGDLSSFYVNVRWENWKTDLIELHGNQGYSFYPFLWTEHENITALSRKAVSITEIWELQQDFVKQLTGKK
ncbi:DUF2625 domain-containing protein [Cellulophaga sp. Z1A5H]|uniref:DUF2625 domain-containing protein n=1 Tax=Cellulophaga sp. Z1A5H TaxID=2687291 RepID=UPI0013FD968D|nr:DUF2625 domain-containing protein [Cellulophaga sp. Z1A5H]